MVTSLSCIWAIEHGALTRLIGEARARLACVGPIAVEGQTARDELPLDVRDSVAVIPISGVMEKGAFWANFFGVASTDRIRQAVQTAATDTSVKTILLNIDSPGGSVDGLAELGDAVFAAREKKRVVAQVNGTAASAAYYVASQADQIFMGRMDMVGSIGVRLLLYDWSRLFENEGIKPVVMDSGWFKSAGAMGTEITEQQQEEFQRVVDGFFDEFVSAVARGRKITRPAVRKVADGRLFFAEEAKAASLVDGVRTFDETFARLRIKPKPSTARRARAVGAIHRARFDR